MSNDTLANIPFYSTDVGRIAGGNRTGQPAVTQGGETMYPSAARTQLVRNPIYREGGPLPQMIPADLAEVIIRTLSSELKK